MNNLELINKLYKPYKITKKGKCTIITSTSGKFAIKETKNDIKKIYKYLDSRGFTNFPKMIDKKNNLNIFEYKDAFDYPKEQKASDLIDTLINLHSKTIFTKEVRENTYKRIWESIDSNLNYYKDLYTTLTLEFEKEVFMSPSHYLFLRNVSKLFSQIEFCRSKLNNWYENVKKLKNYKVCTVHNNLCLDHYIKDDKGYFISWDKSYIDSPVMDLYSFYKNEALNLDFKNLIDKYFNSNIIDENEKELFFILICMPVDISFEIAEIDSCINLEEALDYVFKTEELVRPYYSLNNEDENNDFNN